LTPDPIRRMRHWLTEQALFHIFIHTISIRSRYRRELKHQLEWRELFLKWSSTLLSLWRHTL